MNETYKTLILGLLSLSNLSNIDLDIVLHSVAKN